MEYGELKFSEN
jgi:8-oxo-dGTP pyrophosphatase MutT (NUDIX family)